MKTNAKGEYLSTKGRFVAGGHRADPNVYDPLEKHSPTVPFIRSDRNLEQKM